MLFSTELNCFLMHSKAMENKYIPECKFPHTCWAIAELVYQQEILELCAVITWLEF